MGGYPLEFHPPSADSLLAQVSATVRPACIEETCLRGGTVHFLASSFGCGWAYLGGSVLFALPHFCGGGFSLRHFVCLGSGGLLLTTVYLKHGLLAAIGVHFAWNVLCWYLTVAMHYHRLGGYPAPVEDLWSTTLILLIATVAGCQAARKAPTD